MSDNHDPHSIHRQVRIYLSVFVALLVATVVTVGASYLPIQSVPLTIATALFISCVEGFLVAGYMMHLLSERKMIYAILVITVVFFTALMFLISWATHPSNRIHLNLG